MTVKTGIPNERMGLVPDAGTAMVVVVTGVAADCGVVTTGVIAPPLTVGDAGTDPVSTGVVFPVTAFTRVVMAKYEKPGVVAVK